LLFIFSVALSARLIFLDRIPTGMSDDEVLFPLSSRSFNFTGKDLTEQWSPLSLSKPSPTVTQIYGKVPYIIFSPFFGNVNFSMLTARLPYAIFGALFIFVIFFISLRLFSLKVALITSLLAAINPWSIFFSRTAYEAPIGLYFAFAMFALLLYLRSWKILLALPLYFLSFFSYIGTPIVLPLFTALAVFYSWLLNKRKATKYYLLFMLVAFLILIFYVLHLSNDIGGGRTEQLLTPNNPSIVSDVNWSRRESIATPLSGIFINKYENAIKMFSSQYLNAFSPNYLFSRGEGAARFTLWSHGEFYIVDLFFLIIGFVALLAHKRKQAFLLLGLALVAPIPSAIVVGDTQYALRSAFLIPILLIFIGFGIYSFINIFKHKLIPSLIVILIYLILLANFGYIYLLRNPIYNYESFGISGRIISKYIHLADTKGSKVQVLFNGADMGLFRQYLFFNERYTKANHSQIANLFTKSTIVIDNVTFTDCHNINLDKSIITIIPFKLDCTKEALSRNILSVTNYTDNQPVYLIYNDQVCKNYPSLAYMNNFKLSDFNIEKLTEGRFCEKFFTRDAGFNSINSTGSATIN
jgi:hypothetical protein